MENSDIESLKKRIKIESIILVVTIIGLVVMFRYSLGELFKQLFLWTFAVTGYSLVVDSGIIKNRYKGWLKKK